MKRLLTILITLCWIGPALADGLTDMNDEERYVFRQEIRAYLLEHPEVLMEAIAVLEERQNQDQASTDAALVTANSKAIFNDDYSWVGGNPDGDVTLVEFLDYRCTYCRRAHDEIAELVKSDGNIRLVIKEFPILGEQSMLSSRLAVATLHKAGPDIYRELGNFLMTFNGSLTPSNMAELLKKLGADPEVILPYMDSDAVTAQIGMVHELARKLEISGTPTFVIGQGMIRGYAPLANMREIVAYTRDKAN